MDLISSGRGMGFIVLLGALQAVSCSTASQTALAKEVGFEEVGCNHKVTEMEADSWDEEDEEVSGLYNLQLLQVGHKLHRRSLAQIGSTEGIAEVEAGKSKDQPLQLRYQRVTKEDIASFARSEEQRTSKIPYQKKVSAEEDLGSDPDTVNGLLGSMAKLEDFRDTKTPAHKAEGLRFTDEDPRQGFVKGFIQIVPSSNETDVDHYNIYWAANNSALEFIATVPAGASYYNLHGRNGSEYGVKMPKGANQLMVFSANKHGSMQYGQTEDVYDWWGPSIKVFFKGLLHGG
eukprot:TRINITY_DN51538_c0_g1_i1.p1 TRINITY_DN51538_c0_g1~~TRINITY_DN51538_c0_g1_i1.p1  ORF type:complete len:289 (+),score=61.53 TRINITY_DN51538_c0_g1_i1:152-1018(+)